MTISAACTVPVPPRLQLCAQMAHAMAFSSEVDTGSREEKASKQNESPGLVQPEPGSSSA
jgi:hypothetical protein